MRLFCFGDEVRRGEKHQNFFACNNRIFLNLVKQKSNLKSHFYQDP